MFSSELEGLYLSKLVDCRAQFHKIEMLCLNRLSAKFGRYQHETFTKSFYGHPGIDTYFREKMITGS